MVRESFEAAAFESPELYSQGYQGFPRIGCLLLELFIPFGEDPPDSIGWVALFDLRDYRRITALALRLLERTLRRVM